MTLQTHITPPQSSRPLGRLQPTCLSTTFPLSGMTSLWQTHQRSHALPRQADQTQQVRVVTTRSEAGARNKWRLFSEVHSAKPRTHTAPVASTATPAASEPLAASIHKAMMTLSVGDAKPVKGNSKHRGASRISFLLIVHTVHHSTCTLMLLPLTGLDKSVKDLQRQISSLSRLSNVLEDESERALKMATNEFARIKEA